MDAWGFSTWGTETRGVLAESVVHDEVGLGLRDQVDQKERIIETPDAKAWTEAIAKHYKL